MEEGKMADTKIKHPHVTQKKGIHGGRPIVKDSRIPASTIIIYYKKGKEVDEILDLYPQLTPAQVHDVISYYYDYRKQVDNEIEEMTNEDKWKKQYPPAKEQAK